MNTTRNIREASTYVGHLKFQNEQLWLLNIENLINSLVY